MESRLGNRSLTGHILKTDNRPVAARRSDLANIRIDTFGGHTLHVFETGAGSWICCFGEPCKPAAGESRAREPARSISREDSSRRC